MAKTATDASTAGSVTGALTEAKGIAGGLPDLLIEARRVAATVIAGWSAAGRIAPVDPYHLVFMIWATTQHYADFETQIRAILGPKTARRAHFTTARTTLEQVFLKGVAG